MACCVVSFSLNGCCDKIKSWYGQKEKNETVTLYHAIRLQPGEERDEIISYIKEHGLRVFYKQREAVDKGLPYVKLPFGYENGERVYRDDSDADRVYFFDRYRQGCSVVDYNPVKSDDIVIAMSFPVDGRRVRNQSHRRINWRRGLAGCLSWDDGVTLKNYKRNIDSFLQVSNARNNIINRVRYGNKVFEKNVMPILDHNTSELTFLSKAQMLDLYLICHKRAPWTCAGREEEEIFSNMRDPVGESLKSQFGEFDCAKIIGYHAELMVFFNEIDQRKDELRFLSQDEVKTVCDKLENHKRIF